MVIYLNTQFKKLGIDAKLDIYTMLGTILNFSLTEHNTGCAHEETEQRLKGVKNKNAVQLSTTAGRLTPQQILRALEIFGGRVKVNGYQECFKYTEQQQLGNGALGFFKNSRSIDFYRSDSGRRRVPKSLDFFNLVQNSNKGRSHRSSCTESNRRPVQIKAIQTTTVTINSFNYIRLNTAELFVDAEDNNSELRIEMKWASGRAISSTDWIQYNIMLQLIYTWATYDTFVSQPREGYAFHVTATDTCGAQSTILYRLKIKSNVQPPCYKFALLVKSNLVTAIPYTHVIGDLANIISKQLDDPTLSNHLVQSLEQQDQESQDIFTLYFSDMRTKCDPCDHVQVLKIVSKIQQNQAFNSAFNPNFKYLGLTVKWDSNSYDSAPITLLNSPILNVEEYGSIKYQIPSWTFYDAEELFTNNLELSISSISPAVVSLLSGKDLVIYQIDRKPSSVFHTIHLEGKDEKGQKANLTIQIVLNKQQSLPPGYFSFTMTTYYQQASDSKILSLILDTISDYTKQPKKLYSQYIILNFKRSGNFPQQIQISFARTTFFHSTNGYNAFLDMENKLFFRGQVSNLFIAYTLQYMRDTSGQTYDNFNQYSAIQPTHVQPTMMVTKLNPKPTISINDITPSVTIMMTSSTPVPNIPGPVARYQIGPFNVTFCDFMVFPIPEDLFMDQNDGTTSKLKLSMTTLDGKLVPKNSWIFVDSDIQVIYGYLKVDDYVRMGGVKYTEFNLLAANSKGGRTALRFRVRLPEKIPDILYTITMTMTPFYQYSFPEINEQLMILTKISAYFGEPSRFSWINIISFQRSQNENKITIAWTNCTIHGQKCHNTDVSKISSKVVMNNGQPNTKFARSLSPQYIIHDIQAVGMGNCVEPITSSVIPTSSIIITTNPIIVNKIPVLILTTLNYFVYKVSCKLTTILFTSKI